MTPQTVEPGEEGPVTVSISRRIKPGREADYEAWVHGVIEAARGFAGHMGVSILRPSGKTGDRYVLIYRYDSWAHCEAWERSDARRKWTEKLADMVEGDPETRRATGLEAWFELPEVPASKPAPQWKMALVLIAVVFVIVFPLQLLILPLTADWPHWSRTLLIAIIQVLLMTYLVMPRVTALLKNWLFR
nr:hypothetical protein [uncultured bacterium]BAH89750.1 hypothetical protein [uncultured bacterium]BAH90576.1 hypothetical protein [uncultured bacterium]